MSDNPKDIVKDAYDNISQWYLEWVQKDKSPRQKYTSCLLGDAYMKVPSPRVLDLGCGPGVPNVGHLLHGGASVVGCDISSKQLELAKAKFPAATYIQSDIASMSFEASSFNAVTCYYTLFHLPRAEHEDVMKKVFSWLKPGGMFIFNAATFDEEEIHGEFLGYGTFWSSFGPTKYEDMVEKAGYRIVRAEIVKSGDGQLAEDDPDFDVEFWWCAARKPAAHEVQMKANTSAASEAPGVT